MTATLRRHALPVALLVVLCCAALWPALRWATSRFSFQEGDGFGFVWGWWWLGRRSGLSTGLLFHPVGVDLSVTTTAPFVGIVTWPVRAAFGPVVQQNVVQLGSAIVTAVAPYALALRITASRAASVLAGTAFALAPYRFVHTGHLNLVNIWCLPLALLALMCLLDAPTTSRSIGLGAALGCSFLVDPQVAVLTATAVAAFSLSWRPRALHAWRHLTAAAAVGLLVAIPLLVPMATAIARGETDPVRGLGGSQVYSADVLSWLEPPETNPLVGRFSGISSVAPSIEGLAAPGLCLLALALLGRELGDRSRRRGLVALASTGFVLSLGPFLHVAGRSGSGFRIAGSSFAVPLPFLALHQVPGLDTVRAPGRFSVIGVLAIDLLAALAVADLLRRHPGRPGALRFAAVALIAAVELAPGRIPTTSARVPPAYAAVGRDGCCPGAVLELPLQWSTGGEVVGDLAARRYDARVLWYATRHGRPIVSGYASRYPSRRLLALTTRPLYRQVLSLEDEPGFDDPAVFGPADLRAAGIGYVVYHRDRPLPRAEQHFARSGLPVVADDGTVLIWGVPLTGTAAP